MNKATSNNTNAEGKFHINSLRFPAHLFSSVRGKLKQQILPISFGVLEVFETRWVARHLDPCDDELHVIACFASRTMKSQSLVTQKDSSSNKINVLPNFPFSLTQSFSYFISKCLCRSVRAHSSLSPLISILSSSPCSRCLHLIGHQSVPHVFLKGNTPYFTCIVTVRENEHNK